MRLNEILEHHLSEASFFLVEPREVRLDRDSYDELRSENGMRINLAMTEDRPGTWRGLPIVLEEQLPFWHEPPTVKLGGVDLSAVIPPPVRHIGLGCKQRGANGRWIYLETKLKAGD